MVRLKVWLFEPSGGVADDILGMVFQYNAEAAFTLPFVTVGH